MPSLRQCLKTARRKCKKDVDVDLLDDLSEVWNAKERYEKSISPDVENLDEVSAGYRAVQEAINRAVEDYNELVGRVKELAKERPDVSTEEQPEPSPPSPVSGTGGPDVSGGSGEQGGDTGAGGGSGGSPSGQPVDDGSGDNGQRGGDGGGTVEPSGGGRQSPESPEPDGGSGSDREGGEGTGGTGGESGPTGVGGESGPQGTVEPEDPWGDIEKEIERELEGEPTAEAKPEPTENKPAPQGTGGGTKAAPKPKPEAKAEPKPETKPPEEPDPEDGLIDLFVRGFQNEGIEGGTPAPQAVEDPRQTEKWGPAADFLDKIAQKEGDPNNLKGLAAAIVGKLKKNPKMTPAKARAMMPYIKAWAEDVRNGNRNPWAEAEAEPAAEPAPEPVPEEAKAPEKTPEEIDDSAERSRIFKSIIKRVEKRGAEIPAEFAGDWQKKKELFDEHIKTLQETFERLDWQGDLTDTSKRANRYPESITYYNENQEPVNYNPRHALDALRHLANVDDKYLLQLVESTYRGFRYVNTNLEYGSGRLRRTTRPKEFTRDGDYFTVRGENDVWQVLMDFADARLVANADKRKTPKKQLDLIRARLYRMAKWTKRKGYFTDSSLNGFSMDLIRALNLSYPVFIEQIERIAKELKNRPLQRTDVQKRMGQIKNERAKRRYDNLSQSVREALDTVEEGHEKRPGFERRYQEILDNVNDDEIASYVNDLETLLLQIERRNDQYVPPDPVVDYVPQSNIEDLGGISLGSKMPSGQYPGWKSYMEAFARMLRGNNTNIDEWVAQKLGYENAQEIADFGYLAAEQIDTVADIIRQIDTDGAFILADQTGVGKGRQLAAAGIAYAARQKMPVIFMTEKPTLFVDIIRDLEDIGMRKMTKDGKAVPGRFVSYGVVNSGLHDANAGIKTLDNKTVPLQGVHRNGPETARILEAVANDGWEKWEADVMFVTYSQFHATDVTKDKKAKMEEPGPAATATLRQSETDPEDVELAVRRMNAIKKIATEAVVIMDEAHEAAGQDKDAQIITRAGRKGYAISEINQSRGGYLRELVRRSKSVIFSSATFAKRAENYDIYAMRTNMWRSLVGVRDVMGQRLTLKSLFARGGVALQQIFSGMLARDGAMARRSRSMDDAKFENIDIDANIADIDAIASATRSISDWSTEIMAPIFTQMQQDMAAQAPDGMTVTVTAIDFKQIMHNFIESVYASLTVEKVTEQAIAQAKEGKKVIVTFSNTGQSMLEDFMIGNDLTFDSETDFSMADVAKAYLKRMMRYKVTTRVGGREVDTPVYRFIDPAELGPESEARYNEMIEQFDETLSQLIGNPMDYTLYKMKEAGIRMGEITGRSMYIEPSKENEGKWVIRRRSQSGTAHNRQMVKKFNGGLAPEVDADQYIPPEDQIDAVIMNKSGAVGTSMHASSKFGNQNQRVMFIASPEKDINLYMQILGRIDRTGQVLEREVDGQMVANNPTYYITDTNIPAEIRMRAVLEKKLESLNANLQASGKTGVVTEENEETITNEQLISGIGSWAIAGVLRDNPKWAETMMIAAVELRNDAADADQFNDDVARKATNRLAFLNYEDQIKFYDDAIDRYRAEAQRRRMMGQNVGAMAVHDIRAIGRRAMTLEKAIGTSVFEGPIEAIEVVAEYTNDPIDLRVVTADAEKFLADKGQPVEQSIVGTYEETGQATFKYLREAGVKYMGDLLRAADEEAERIKQEIKDDPDLRVTDKDARIRNIERSKNNLIHGDRQKTSGLEGLFHKIKPGALVKVHVNGEWRQAWVSRVRHKFSVNPYSLTSWKADLVIADAHDPIMRGVAFSNMLVYNPNKDGIVEGTLNVDPVDPKSTNIRYAERDMLREFARVKKMVEEGVEKRILIMGNIIRAYAKYGEQRGMMTQITDPNGNMGVAYLLKPQYNNLDNITALALNLENGVEMYEFMKIGFRDGRSPQIYPHPKEDGVIAYLNSQDKDGNNLDYGNDLVLDIPNTNIRKYSLKSKFGSKEFLAYINRVPIGDLEGSDAIGAKDIITNVPYHFEKIVSSNGKKVTWRLRIPMRKDTADIAIRALQYWRNNTNPDAIRTKFGGSVAMAEEAIKEMKRMTGRAIRPWDGQTSVLADQGFTEKTVRNMWNGGDEFTYNPDVEMPDSVVTPAEAMVRFLEKQTGASVLGSRIAKDFVDYGSTNLLGLKAETAEDIAIIGQAMRHPMFEKMTVFFVRGGKIIDYFSTSNRLPGSVSVEGQDSLKDAVKQYMAANDADGWYITHNHPGGDPDPSGGLMPIFEIVTADRGLTIQIAEQIEGFLGHVVINETEYGVVPPQHITALDYAKAKTGGDVEWGYKRKLPKSVINDKRRWSTKKWLRDDDSVHEFLELPVPEGQKLHDKESFAKVVAAAGKKLGDADKTFVIVGLSGGKEVTGVTTVPLTLIEQASKTPRGLLKLTAWLRKYARLTSANELATFGIPSQYDELVQKALDNGLIRLAVKDDTFNTTMSPELSLAQWGKAKEDIFFIEPGDKWRRIIDEKNGEDQNSQPKIEAKTANMRGGVTKAVREQVQKILGPKNTLLKRGKIRVVANDTNLPGHLQHPDGGVKGVVDPETKEIWIVANNVRGNVRGVLMHELGVHAGLKGLLGKKYSDVMRQLRGLRAVKNAAVLEAYANVPPDTAEVHMDEEALGYLVENKGGMSILNKIMAATRAWLFQKGILVKNLSEKDLVALAAAAARAYRGNVDPDPNGPTGPSDGPPMYSRWTDRINETVDKVMGREEPTSEFHRQNEYLRERHKTLWYRAKQMLKRQLMPGGLLPDEVFDEKIRRDSKMGIIEIEIRSLVGMFEDEVKKAYGKAYNKLDEATKALINEAITGTMPDSFAEEHKDLAASIMAMRGQIDDLSRLYLVSLQREIDILKANNKDAAAAAKEMLLEKIKSNIGAYMNRSYQMFDDPNWAKKIPDEIYDNARAFLREQYEAKAQVYDEWADKAEDRGEMEKAAKHRAEAERLRNPNTTEQTLETLVKTGTAFDDLPTFIRESKLGAKDLTVLMRRKDIAPEIRALFGEYTDVRVNFARTATKMGRLVYNQQFLDRLLESGLGNFLWQERDADRPQDARVKIAGDSADAYSPLNGLMTYPEIEQAFRDALGKETMAGWYQKVVQINGMVKYGKTVLSPTTAFRNWMSAAFFALANGHFNFAHMRDSVKSLREYFIHKGDGLEYLKELKGLGVVYDTPYAGEMMRLLAESRIEQNLMTGGKMGIKQALDFATSFYQFGDDFWKILGWENERRLLMKMGMSEQEAKVAAAERIRNTYPTYSMTGLFVNKLRRFPLAGTFVSFPSEIVRTSYNILNYAYQDMQNPQMRPLAMRRIAGIAIASASMHALQTVFMSLANVDDDEEEAFRDLAAPWQRNSNIVPLPFRDKNGNLQFIDASFVDPYNYLKRPLNAILRDQPWEDAFKDVLRETFVPFFGTDIAAGALIEVATNQRETGGRVYNPSDLPQAQLLDMTTHIAKTIQPGISSWMLRMVSALRGKISPSGREYSVGNEMAAFVGFRVSTHDPRAALYYKSFQFRDMKRDATSIMTSVARDPNKVSDSELKAAFQRSMKVRTRAYIEMTRLVSAARASGMPETKLRQVLRQSGISKNDVSSLMTGVLPTYRPSKGYLRQAVNKARVLFPDRAADIEGRRKLLRDMTYQQ